MFETFIKSAEYVSIAGSSLAIIGAIILAFSMSRVFWELGFGIKAISLTIQAFSQGGDIPVFLGLDKRIDSAQRVSKVPTFAGILLVCLSLPFQAYSLHLSTEKAELGQKGLDNSHSSLASEILSIQKSLDDLRQQVTGNSIFHAAKISEIGKQQEKLQFRLHEIKKKIDNTSK